MTLGQGQQGSQESPNPVDEEDEGRGLSPALHPYHAVAYRLALLSCRASVSSLSLDALASDSRVSSVACLWGC